MDQGAHETRPRPASYGKQPVAPPSLHMVDFYEADLDDELVPLIEHTKAELMDMAKERGLSIKGKKQDIIDRLVDDGVEE